MPWSSSIAVQIISLVDKHRNAEAERIAAEQAAREALGRAEGEAALKAQQKASVTLDKNSEEGAAQGNEELTAQSATTRHLNPITPRPSLPSPGVP